MTSVFGTTAIRRLLVALVSIFILSVAVHAQETETGVLDIPGFDHAELADFPLTGQHAEIICESCHVDNQLEGTPRSCVGCHNGDRAAGKPADHPAAGDDCAQCHTTTNFTPFAFSHVGITSGCVECHNGVRAPGKPASHPPAGNDCQQCHTTNNFVPFDFDHTAIQQDCTACHNGNTARGQSADHISVAASCDNCHVTTAFTDVRMEHSVVGGNCADCHNNTVATGQPADHIPVFDQDCASCHSTFVFTGGILDHTLFEQGCATCHNNDIAAGKPVDHLPAPETCNDCHSPYFEQTFASVDLDHDVVPGDCASCHFQGNPWDAPFQPADHPPASQDCASCHSTFAFSVGQDANHAEFIGNCVDCHYPGNPFGADFKPPAHNDVSETCDGCHVSTRTFAQVQFDHSETTGLCANCHVASAFYDAPTTAQAEARHANVTSDDCSDCHSTFAFVPLGVSPMPHADVVGACAVCHQDGNPFGDAPVTADAPTQHTAIMTNVCEDCHNTTSFSSILVSPLPHEDIVGSCSQCHVAGSVFGNADTPPAGDHALIASTECNDCHSTTAFMPAAVSPIPHDDIVGTCFACHSDTDPFDDADSRPVFHVNSWGGYSTDCVDCHTNAATTLSFSGSVSPASMSALTDNIAGFPLDGKLATGEPACNDCHLPLGVTAVAVP